MIDERTSEKMKFGHQLESVVNNTAEDIRDKFLQYKALKKTLKSIPSGNDSPEAVSYTHLTLPTKA